jgi:hypothetical protein
VRFFFVSETADKKNTHTKKRMSISRRRLTSTWPNLVNLIERRWHHILQVLPKHSIRCTTTALYPTKSSAIPHKTNRRTAAMQPWWKFTLRALDYLPHTLQQDATSELSMGWVDSWVGLGWVGLGWVGLGRVFRNLNGLGWVGLDGVTGQNFPKWSERKKV